MNVKDRLAEVQDRIDAACDRAGRDPSEVTLVAVSKRHPVASIAEAHAAGARVFGENYVQEWQAKAEDPALLRLPEVRWSFIGHLQRNKVRFLIGRVDLIETVDSLRLAREISRRAEGRGRGFSQGILLQVNLAAEPGKSGFLVEEIRNAFEELARLPGVDVQGLMHIPSPRPDASSTRADHAGLRTLRDELRSASGLVLRELSMGMSSDFEAAIEEGATRVRVGTALFGPRQP